VLILTLELLTRFIAPPPQGLEVELSYTRIDIAKHEETRTPMGDFIARGNPSDVWVVPFSPINFTDIPDYRHYKREQAVHVPVFAYLVPDDPVDALGFAFQLGVAAVSMRQQPLVPVQRLHVVIGHPVHQVEDEVTGHRSLQFHLGFALLLAR
jgi:hypothetical protein